MAKSDSTDDISKGTLKTVATELGVEGRSSLSATELAQAIVDTVHPATIAADTDTSDFPEQPPAGQLPPR